MSNIYIKEPPTRGKVLLHTSFGDLDVELWADQAPLACRNFVQLCMEGYYDGTIFHRLIKNMMIQGGDPRGDGSGGESVYGKPFRDEFHPRLRFSHRGILAMANNADQPHTNQSQFFLTFAPAEWLQGKHTIFGKVAGNTIYNLMKCNEFETDENDRPVYPPRLISAEVLADPFDDIVVRATVRRGQAGNADGAAEDGGNGKKKKKKKRKAVKNMSLLSFGEEAVEEEATLKAILPEVVKVKSSFDLGKAGGSRSSSSSTRQASADEASSAQQRQQRGTAGEEDTKTVPSSSTSEDALEVKDPEALRAAVKGAADLVASSKEAGLQNFAARQRLKIEEMERLMAEKRALASRGGEGPTGKTATTTTTTTTTQPSALTEKEERRRKRREKKAAKKAAKAERKAWLRDVQDQRSARLDGNKAERAIRIATGERGEAENAQEQEQDLLSHVQQMQRRYKKRKRAVGDREEETLALLSSFKKDLQDRKRQAAAASGKLDNNAKQQIEGEGSFRVAANRDGTLGAAGDDSGDDDADWATTKLKFVRHIDDKLRGFAPSSDDYVTVDPLLAQEQGDNSKKTLSELQRDDRDRRSGISSSSGSGRGAGTTHRRRDNDNRDRRSQRDSRHRSSGSGSDRRYRRR